MPRSRSRLYRRPESPFWWAVWTDHQKRVHRQSTGCRDHAAAAAWLAARELERSRADLGFAIARPTSLLQATAEYLTERRPLWSNGWYTAVEGFVANRVLPQFGEGRSVSSITRADVERFRAGEVGRPGRGGKPTSSATTNRLMAALAAFGEWCQVEGRAYHTANPWAGHEPLPEDQLPVPELEEEQIQRLLSALEQPEGPLPPHGRRRYRVPWRAVFEFARETGLRRGELGRLRREDIRGPVLYVVSTARRGRTKSGKMRPLPLSTRARAILDELPKRTDGLVFGPLPDPRRARATAGQGAGRERAWLHLARHLFASRLAERGAGRHELRDAGGWSSTRMVDRYTHARMERLAALVEGPPGHTGGTPGPDAKTGGPESPEPPADTADLVDPTRIELVTS
jgi:integrase